MEDDKEEKVQDKKNEIKDLEKNNDVKEKEKEIIERNEKEEGEGIEKVVIELGKDLENHIKNKIFSLNEKIKFSFTFLYKKMSRKSFFKNIYIFYSDSYASTSFNEIDYIFFYKLIPVEVDFIYQDALNNEIEKFSICSTYELMEYSEVKKCKPYLKIDNNKYEFNYIFETNDPEKLANLDKIKLVQDYRNYDDYKKENPPTTFPKNNEQLEPEKLSKFFDLFFKFETKSNFEYWYTKKRDYLIYFIIVKFIPKTKIYCLKICGPSGIGKSMTLFLISRYYRNILYYNLKTIRLLNEQKDDLKIQNILVESCKYLNLSSEQETELSSLIKKNRFFSFFLILKKIVNFLINNEILSAIILDQFKYDSIDEENYNEISLLISKQEVKKVKLLICSSTNDKEIRNECIKSWKDKIFFLRQYNENTQQHYFYIDELCEENEKENDHYGLVLDSFNYIPKYKNKFKYLKDKGNTNETTAKLNQDLIIIKEKIKENLKKLYSLINENESQEIITMKMLGNLRYLSLNINKRLDYKKIEEFANICSFKYFKFKFEENYFSINYNFPYINEIINEIINTHLQEFFQYQRKNEHFGSASSDFFELFSGKSIKDGVLKLPESSDPVCVKVNEIVEMKEFIKSSLDDLMKKKINADLTKYTAKESDFEEKKKKIEKELEERNFLLNLDKYINYNDRSIDYYRLQYINNLKKDYDILGNHMISDMSVFINQDNQRGRMLDLAYVYGKKDNKTFIGFQMKAYDEESSHDIKFDYTKNDIKMSLQPMIINIKYLMGMEIKSWNYVTIILYDKGKEEGKQYFKKIVNLCEKNGLEYIFYEPYENQFYNRKFEKIKEFSPTVMSNLDNNEDILPINIMNDFRIDKYMKDFSDYMKEKKYNNADYIEEGLTSLINKKRKRDKSDYENKKQKKNEIKQVLFEITSHIEVKFHFNYIKFVGAYKFLITANIPYPKENYLFLITSNDEDIYYISIKNQYDVEEYYKYNFKLATENYYEKDSKIITKIDPCSMRVNINMKEKFYVFKYEK